MAATIKVDTVLQTFSWQDDQDLDPSDAVDLVVPGENSGEWTPTSQVGKGGDAKQQATTQGAAATDKIK